MTTPGRDKKDKRKAQAVEADKAGTVATAGEKGETVGDADPPKEPAPAANPSTAEPNRPLKAQLAALTGEVEDLKTQLAQQPTQQAVDAILQRVEKVVNGVQRTQDKVHAAQGLLRDHARELEALQSTMADVQSHIIKLEVLQTMLKQQDGFQKETLKLVLSQELASSMGALQSFILDNILPKVHTATPDPGPSAPSAPPAAPSSEDESEQEDKMSFGRNAQGKPYASKEAAQQARDDKKKKEGQKKRRKPNSNGEQLVSAAQLQ
eukprot:CAMPEP_0202420028 /NCGR_PEP_ID=MMETSP1128-20130828/49607_1 /ASSEMBLY_ACC=CAM_ASM_000463 /TAXON_ID=3047 /ORGANISM="Dunaliella tertiolecta, Strain CCMP1320" /LENGTH=264 /DNA_ID=CAMNT_0049027997 /DNA_START=101 /DNA_END=892 /DNA_ORIENTATION=-